MFSSRKYIYRYHIKTYASILNLFSSITLQICISSCRRVCSNPILYTNTTQHMCRNDTVFSIVKGVYVFYISIFNSVLLASLNNRTNMSNKIDEMEFYVIFIFFFCTLFVLFFSLIYFFFEEKHLISEKRKAYVIGNMTPVMCIKLWQWSLLYIKKYNTQTHTQRQIHMVKCRKRKKKKEDCRFP